MARILVIDDEDLVRMMLRETLEKAGHLVSEASDGGEGLRCFHEETIDLVITDLFMPEKEGLDFIREAKMDSPEAKIVAMTADHREGANTYLEMAEMFGAARTLFKPVERDELLGTVSELLE